MLTASFKKIILVLLVILSTSMIWKKVAPNQANKFAKLSITLGEDIHETQAHSTYDLKIFKHEPRETDLFAVDNTPTIFEYRDPQLGFSLPPTILVTIGTENSKVQDVQTYPQLKLLNLKDSKELLKKLVAVFDNKGWQRNLIYDPPDPDSLRAEDFEHRLRHEIVVAAWKNGNKSLLMSIKREKSEKNYDKSSLLQILGFKELPQDYFLIEVSVRLDKE